MDYLMTRKILNDGHTVHYQMEKYIKKAFDENHVIVKKELPDKTYLYYFYDGRCNINTDLLPLVMNNPPVITLNQSMINFIAQFEQK